ncbi:MAG: hypothetical protein ACRDJI_09560 [Actinomycetota bacterium]
MRKAIAALLIGGLVLALGTAPATAKKKRTKKGSVAVQALPFPVTGNAMEGGCLNGVEGAHKHSEPFTTPGAGVLTVDLSAFEGDWDLHVTDASGTVLASSTAGQPVAPPGEQVVVALAARQEIAMVACNWAGGPSATLNWAFVY